MVLTAEMINIIYGNIIDQGLPPPTQLHIYIHVYPL